MASDKTNEVANIIYKNLQLILTPGTIILNNKP